ncbi:MAG: aromatic acid/H+ symport family MFS transporter [Gammaproteobacteria bacterium]|nr:aromatic acid/H+ symport family MFS transporter [Gammaproteobacteria bacterium]
MQDQTVVRVTDSIDNSPVGNFQRMIILLCFLVALLEGYDTQIMAYVAPKLAQEWGVTPAGFGPVFAASLVGLMFGAAGLGWAGDRFGRKPVLLVSITIVGVFTLLIATSSSLGETLVYRFLSGIGIGGTLPNITALVSEFSPRRRRSTLVAVVLSGFPLGAALGGPVSSALIATYGWPWVFVLGGVLPLVLVGVLGLLLPESIRFLAATEPGQQRIGVLLARIDKTIQLSPQTRFEVESPPKSSKSRVGQLFEDGRLGGTLALWCVFFANLLMLYFVINWLPTLFTQGGLELSDAIIATALFSIGGLISGLAIGRLMDSIPPHWVFITAYAIGAASVLALGASVSAAQAPLLIALSMAAGAGIAGPQLAINALAANYYPVHIRSTGLGAALAVGRVGSILGPVVGSAVLLLNWGADEILKALAIPAAACMIAIFAHRAASRAASTRAPSATG